MRLPNPLPEKIKTPLAAAFAGIVCLAVAVVVIATPLLWTQNRSQSAEIVHLLQDHSLTFKAQQKQAAATKVIDQTLTDYARYLDMTNHAICLAVHASCPVPPKR